MQIKVVKTIVHDMKLLQKGHVLEVAEEVGASLVKRGLALAHKATPATAGTGATSEMEVPSSEREILLAMTMEQLRGVAQEYKVEIPAGATKAVIAGLILKTAGYKSEGK